MFWLFAHRRLGGVSLRPGAVYCFLPWPSGSHHSRGTRRECKYQTAHLVFLLYSALHKHTPPADSSCRRLCELHTLSADSQPLKASSHPGTAVSGLLNTSVRRLRWTSAVFIILHAFLHADWHGEGPDFIISQHWEIAGLENPYIKTFYFNIIRKICVCDGEIFHMWMCIMMSCENIQL